MDNVPYDEWCEYIAKLLKSNGIKEGLVLDLGCGTGKLTRRLKAKGYDMIGIDNSEDMLSIAREKSDDGILYLMQDMREFELYGTVNAVISICDCINYITEKEDLLQVFKLVNNYLEKNGVFIFDLNTEYKYSQIIGDSVIADNRENESFIWENTYYEEEKINEYEVTLFIKKDSGLYEKHVETHYQRAYSLKEIKGLLQKAGMEFITSYDAFTNEPVRNNSERIYIIAKEGYQEGKVYT
ncbi:MAG: class I SAM-dependent methyltransferase [Lachnospiraceae bacterium]|nr:class I SAM-dependent methyltransferase [Lachnospiraceae bacterium]